MTFMVSLLVFGVLFNAIFGIGCAVSALNPRNRAKGFFVDTLWAALALTAAFACAWNLDGRLGW